MTNPVGDSWDLIVPWLHRYAPVSAAHLGPPATEDDIAFVEALVDRQLPAGLLAWWRRSCGTTGHRELLIPTYTPYTIDEAVDRREMMLEIASCEDDAETAELAGQPAGSPCTPCWLPVWVPIAQDGMGCYLFTDLRPGPLHGCVMKWDKYEAAVLKPRWPGVAAMLAEIAHALENGTDIEGYEPEARDDGILDWV
jgi:cell wall assembly regulator SMI1